MRGSGRVAAIVLVLLAGAGLLLSRGKLRDLAIRFRLAFLAVVTVLCASMLVRGLLSEGDRRLVALGAFVVVAPCVVLAWRDFLRTR
ncbi:MAG TPA: hypothetical protein VE129_10460 [Thermoanaerobaculia bacterium]|nr:hypothetical protein [Thermoanaerobaculia bacterium]